MPSWLSSASRIRVRTTRCAPCAPPPRCEQRLPELNKELEREFGITIGNRTGVNTGEVVTGDPGAGGSLVTGDTVNTAARLEQAAPSNGILLGAMTFELVRDAVAAVPVTPVAAKGKAEPVLAYLLESVRGYAPGRIRHLDSPIVGREAELTSLRPRIRRLRLDPYVSARRHCW